MKFIMICLPLHLPYPLGSYFSMCSDCHLFPYWWFSSAYQNFPPKKITILLLDLLTHSSFCSFFIHANKNIFIGKKEWEDRLKPKRQWWFLLNSDIGDFFFIFFFSIYLSFNFSIPNKITTLKRKMVLKLIKIERTEK